MKDPVQHMKDSITEGKHWYISLLESIGLWTIPEEDYDGRHFKYLIAGEAFDWFLLAERLCLELEGLVPEDERIDLLFGKPPIEISPKEFKEIIGSKKYRAFLNYFYGVTVEQALQFAVQTEIEKEQHGKIRHHDPEKKAFQRIYHSDEMSLLERFQKGNVFLDHASISLNQMDEFTYWLFKYRFANSDSARVASDTRKALKLLEDWGILPSQTDKL